MASSAKSYPVNRLLGNAASHQIHGVSLSAPHVGDLDSRVEALGQAGYEGKNAFDQDRIVHGRAVLRHHW